MSRTLVGRVGRWSVVAVAATLGGCGFGAPKQVHDPSTYSAAQASESGTPARRISEGVWVALSSLPRRHLMRAREMFMVHQTAEAARDFEAAGALVRLEGAHTDDAVLHRRLERAGIELRELGRSLQRQDSMPIQEIDDVMTRAYLALAEEQGQQAARAFRDGLPSPAGTYMEQTAAEMERAYERANMTLTPRTRSTLLAAEQAAQRLANDESQKAIKAARAALGALRKDSTRLESALGARGR